jgi:phosphoglycolate phosphatase
MSLKTAIFDLDGTLLDTLQDLAHAGNAVLAECGYPEHPIDAYKIFVGDGLRVLMERIVPKNTTPSDIDHCVQLFNTIYADCWDNKSKPYAGIMDMLTSLRQHDIRCSVLSNKPHQFTSIYIDRFFPQSEFEVVFGQREGVEKKPNPAGALEIAKIMNVKPSDCAYIGDTAVDMQTGKSAGMFTIGVLWGFRDIEELQQNNADLIVNSPMEIVKHVVSSR